MKGALLVHLDILLLPAKQIQIASRRCWTVSEKFQMVLGSCKMLSGGCHMESKGCQEGVS